MRRLASLLLLGALAACGSGGGTAAPPVGPAAKSVKLPASLAGLGVTAEKDATKTINDEGRSLTEGGTVPYVTDSVVYTLRSGEELKAVLQLSRLSADARPDDRDWRREVVLQIGRGPVGSPIKRGDVLVYDRQGTKQSIHIWFNGHIMYVLALRQQESVEGEGLGFDPETLLEEAVRITPA